MLWNWYSVDTCFLSSSWHNTTKGMFAGSVIGVFILVILIEAVRRGGREYDRYLSKNALGRVSSSNSGVDGNDAGPSKATQDLEAPAAGFAIGSTIGQ
jgi:copper transporter 1